MNSLTRFLDIATQNLFIRTGFFVLVQCPPCYKDMSFRINISFTEIIYVNLSEELLGIVEEVCFLIF